PGCPWHLRQVFSSRACEKAAREGAAHGPDVALRHPQGVADVAGAVTVHVAPESLRELAALPDAHVVLGDGQCVPDVDRALSGDVAAVRPARAPRRRGWVQDGGLVVAEPA